MVAEARPRPDWEGRLLRWANAGLEAIVLYAVLAAWARPRDGAAALLPLLVCLALPAAYAVRTLLDSTTVGFAVGQVASVLAALAWGFAVARWCAPPGYWQADTTRAALLLGVVFGGREAGLQPLAFWASLLLWWRGQALPAWEPGIEEALGRFRLGCLALGAAVGFAATADAAGGGGGGNRVIQVEQALAVVAFFVAVLLTTGLGRRREMAGGAPIAPAREAGPTAAKSGFGLAPLLVIAVALFVLAFAAWGADALTPQALAPALGLGGQILQTIGAGLAWLVGLLVGLWPTFIPPPSPDLPPRPNPGSGERPFGPLTALPDWVGPLLVLASLVGTAALLALFYYALRRILRDGYAEAPSAVEGSDDQLPTPIAPRGPATIVARLLQLLRSLFSRPRTPLRLASSASLVGPAPDPGLSSIRAAYRAFLTWAAAHQCARRPDETPDEFRRRLAESRPETEPEAALLTDLYVAARYGGRPCPPAELQRAERALSRLKTSDEI